MQIRQNKIGICGGLFLAIPDLKLKNLNETSIKKSYSGEQLIRVKSLQDTKLYFGLIIVQRVCWTNLHSRQLLVIWTFGM